ncbi:MAG TPA: tetratricopeptide repeat protein [Nannocystaceae bacterium]|nr:tetratricopeptide repeat protein [Nannocystaceae bacterium]
MSIASPLALVLVLLAPTLEPEAPRADNVHYRVAEQAFADGRWQDALAALERAYGVDPRPEYLFMQAQVLRTHDRCAEAIAKYREFLAAGPPREDVLSAQAGLALCGETTPSEVAAPRPVEPRPAPAPAPAPSVPPRKRSADPVAHALMWPGLAVAGAGAGLLAAAHVRAARAHRADSEPEFERRAGPTPAMSYAGIALLSIGGAALVAGIVRQIVVSRRTKKSPARVLVVPVLVGR